MLTCEIDATHTNIAQHNKPYMSESSAAGTVEDSHQQLLSSLTSLASLERLQTVPELFSAFLDACSWELADHVYNLTLAGAPGSRGAASDSQYVAAFVLLSSRAVKPRESLLQVQEKLYTVSATADSLSLTATTWIYLLYSLQLALNSLQSMQQQRSALSSLLGCVDGFTRRKQAAREEQLHRTGELMHLDDGTGAEAALGSESAGTYTSFTHADMLLQLLRFTAGLATRSRAWNTDFAMLSAAATDSADLATSTTVRTSSEGLLLSDLTGFVLMLVGALVPLITDPLQRNICLQHAISCLTGPLQQDPLFLLTHAERRRYIYWSTYMYLLKGQDPHSEICKSGGLYGSGLDDKSTQGAGGSSSGGGVSITGFERMLWNQLPGAGEGRHRDLMQKYAAACLHKEPNALLPVASTAVADTVTTRTGFARGAEIVPASALTDRSLDQLFDELLSHEDAPHTNKSALSVIRRQAARHGLFCDLPHSLVGSALVTYAMLCPPMKAEEDKMETKEGVLTQEPPASSPLPQIYSLSYLHELCSGALFPLLHTPKLATFEGVSLLVRMSALVRAMQGALLASSAHNARDAHNADLYSLPGYVFVPCMALEPPRLPLPPGGCSSSVGAAAGTSGLAAFTAVQAKYNFECIKQRLDKERQAATRTSTIKQSNGTDLSTLLNRVESVAYLACMSTRSCDALMLVQTCVTAIQKCPSEQLARDAFDALKMQLMLFEPRSLLLLLRKMVRECPYPGMTALLIDVARDATQLFARGGSTLPAMATTNAAIQFTPESDAEAKEMRMAQEIQELARLEQEHEDAMLAEEEDETERERREEEARQRQELIVEDSILVHKTPWWSPLVLDAFALPVLAIGKFTSGTDVIKNLLQHNHCGSLEASISLYLFFAIRLNAALESGDRALAVTFWGLSDGLSDQNLPLQKHCKSLLLARKALKMAIKETDVDDPEGDIAAVSATTPQDCLRLQVLFMNVDRVIKLLK